MMRGSLGLAAAAVLAGIALCGCGTNYSWRPAVPCGMRTVAVPTFRNESDLQEIGAVAARQVLREFQREGTFKVVMQGDAALEIQGVVVSVSPGLVSYSRRTAQRLASYEATACATVTFVDKRRGKVLVDNRPYTAIATYMAGQDSTTALRDVSGRLMDDLARQVVDDALNLDFGKEE